MRIWGLCLLLGWLLGQAPSRAAPPAGETLPADQAVQQVFRQPEFSWKHAVQPTHALEPDLAWLERLAAAWNSLWGKLPHLHLPGDRIFSLLKFIGDCLIGVVIIVLVGLISPLFRSLLRWRNDSRDLPLSGERLLENLADDPEVLPRWQKLCRAAGQARSEGQSRLAVRGYYLAVLSYLEERELIRYARGNTNREYVQMVPASEAVRVQFEAVTRGFDRCWYGGETPQVEIFLQECRQILPSFSS